MACSIFNQFKDFAYCRLAEFFFASHLNQTAQINTAAENIAAAADITRKRFSRQSCRVQSRMPRHYYSVQRNLFPRSYYYDISDFYVLGRNLLNTVCSLKICIIRSDVHKLSNGLSRFPYRIVLKEFTHLIEQHYRHCFRIISHKESSHGSHRHEKVFVKNLSVGNVSHCLKQHSVAHNKVWNQERSRFRNRFCEPYRCGCHKQHCSCDESYQSLFHSDFNPLFPLDFLYCHIRLGFLHNFFDLLESFFISLFFHIQNHFGSQKIN